MEIRRRVADPYQWPLVGLGSAFPRELDPDVHQFFTRVTNPDLVVLFEPGSEFGFSV